MSSRLCVFYVRNMGLSFSSDSIMFSLYFQLAGTPRQFQKRETRHLILCCLLVSSSRLPNCFFCLLRSVLVSSLEAGGAPKGENSFAVLEAGPRVVRGRFWCHFAYSLVFLKCLWTHSPDSEIKMDYEKPSFFRFLEINRFFNENSLKDVLNR